MEYFETGRQSKVEPIPAVRLDDSFVATDGHTRGVAWYLNGYEEVLCEWEDCDLGWDMYRICVAWYLDEHIYSMVDLKDRFLDPADYEVLWLHRCRLTRHELEKQRRHEEHL
ncbi:MAG: hypothetical protein QXS20_08055 [Candidatus Thorarchaeota archaeon]